MEILPSARYNKTDIFPAMGGDRGELQMKEIRFGIIGMGVQGSYYAGILAGRHSGGVEIPQPEGCVLGAVCSRSDKSREAALLGVPWFRDWRELLESGMCDAVILTVPHFQHHEIAIAALERGIHVLCEKPAGVRASDVRRMLDAQAKSTAKLGMFLQQRTIPLFNRIRQIVASGELGELRRSNWIINTYWRPDSYYASGAWRGTWKGEGGGILVNQLPHYLDLWLYLCGTPERVFARNRHGAHRKITVENDVTVLAEYPNGATGVFVACTHDPMGTDRLELDFDRGKIVVEDSARAQIHRFRDSEDGWNKHLSSADMEQLSKTEAHHDTEFFDEGLPYGISHAGIMENFARHIRLGEPLIATGLDGLRQVELANAIQLSGWVGEMIPIPCDSDRYDRELKKRMDAE